MEKPWLLPPEKFEGTVMNNDADLLFEHAARGNVEEVLQFIEGQSPLVLKDALDAAVENGQLACVEVLLPLCPNANRYTLWTGCYHGYAEVVGALLAHGLTVKDELLVCLEKEHWACAHTLLPYCSEQIVADTWIELFASDHVRDTETACGVLLEHYSVAQLWGAVCGRERLDKQQALTVLENMMAAEQKEVLLEHIEDSGAARTHRKL